MHDIEKEEGGDGADGQIMSNAKFNVVPSKPKRGWTSERGTGLLVG